MPYLTRQDLHRVLQAFIQAEHKQNKRQGTLVQGETLDLPWPESLAMGEEGSPSLGCDSIERLWLAGAVNEMFCLYDSRTENGLLSAVNFGEWVDIVDRGWNHQGKRITFSTSGSGGVPKRCTHAITDLQREVSYLGQQFGNVERIIALAPPHHIYGFLFTAMLPNHLQVAAIDAEPLSPGTLTGLLRRGDLVVSTPLRWEWLVRSIGTWPAGVQGICSTAPCPDWVKQQLSKNGLETFTEVYGSTETAGVGLRTYPAEEYTLMPFWTWAGGDGVPPSLKDGSGRITKLQDVLRVSPDGRFTMEARIDGAVQVGGVNVFPSRIADLLRAVPGVAEAAVRVATGMRAQRLKAFIVPDHSVPEHELAQTLELWTKAFPAPERVCAFSFGPELPKNAIGKPSDWE